jgi:predicted Zn-dependent peptidase
MLRLKSMLAAILALIAVSPAFPQAIAGKTPKGIAYRYQRVPRGEDVAVYFAWRYAADSRNNEGWIYYLVPSMFDGAGDDSKETIQRKLRELGTTHGWQFPLRLTMAAYVTFQRPKLDQVAALLAQILQKPTYAPKDLDERFKKAVMPTQDKFTRDPLNQLQFAELALNLPHFPGDVLLMPMSAATMKPPSSDFLQQLHKRTLGRSNLVVSVVGNLSEGDASSFIDRVFGDLPVLEEPAPLPRVDYGGVDKVIKIERDVPQVYARLYALIAGADDPRQTAASRLAVAAFGNGKDSTLYKILRDEMGAAYSVSSSGVVIAPGATLFKVDVQLDPEKAPAAIARLRDEYRKLLEDGIDEPALKSEVARVTAPFNPAAIVPRERALTNLMNALRGFPEDMVQRLRKAYGELSMQEVNGIISASMGKAATVIVMAPAAVAIKADCKIKAYGETPKCGF